MSAAGLEVAPEPTVNLRRAVELSGVPIRTLYYWMRTGRLPFAVVATSRRVSIADVERCRVYKARER